MSNIANLFDPEVIVLSGSVVGAGEPYLGPARDTLAEMTAAQRRRPIRVVLSTLGFNAGWSERQAGVRQGPGLEP